LLVRALALAPVDDDPVVEEVVQLHVALAGGSAAEGADAHLGVDVEHCLRAARSPQLVGRRGQEAVVAEIEAVKGAIKVVLRRDLFCFC
jgi:hypothetical protein